MEERVQVSIQLPVEQLGRLSLLMEQLSRLLESGSPTAAGESEASPSFDAARFRELQLTQETEREWRGLDEVAGAEAPVSSQLDVAAVRVEDAAERSGAEVAGSEVIGQEPEALSTQIPDFPEMGEIPVASAGAEGRTAEAETADFRMESEARVEAVRREVERVEIAATSAAAAVESELPVPSAGRWDGLREELVAAGPAPLTAEAVSQAFRRDDRRYDRGFPLY